MIINKKSEEFKTFINSKLTQSVKGYKRQLEKVTSNVKMLQQHVSNVRIQFCRIRWKCVVKNLIHVVVKVSSIADVSVLEWNIKKIENETSEVVLESIRTLFDEANVVIPDACIDRAHHVSKTKTQLYCVLLLLDTVCSIVTGRH